MINKILIANRGEIALRIIKTAKILGIKTVTVYSPVDANALFVKESDEAYPLKDNAPKDSYLDINAIIAIAKKSGADSIHPGYGFLSENAEFADACIHNKITWIGPNPKAMRALGSKKNSKIILSKLKIPLIPGYHDDNQDPDTLLQAAKKIGFPVMLKASNGGGGKGMRAVYKEEEFLSALSSVKREALAYFADEEVIIEKLIQNPRHIEVQILGDKHGNVITLFDRDCSMQRRQQKIIEEAPAANLPAKLQQEMQQTALAIAKSIGYDNAGTIEFIIENNKNFYFMEMNTRLQVEHPVTEMITGIDLVEWQIKIAQGDKLNKTYASKGHAIECRICAEDPALDFRPLTGKISQLFINNHENLRVDTGVTQGDIIAPFYDSMIAKIIVWDNTRAAAIAKMEQILKEIIIGGIATNLYYLQALIAHPKFKQAEYNTNFIAHFSYKPKLDVNQALEAIAVFEFQQVMHDITYQGFPNIAWRMHGATGSWYISLILENKNLDLIITPKSATSFALIIGNALPKIINIHENNDLKVFRIANGWSVFLPNGVLDIEKMTLTAKNAQIINQDLAAPMAASVVKIHKGVGAKVEQGEPLIILEAMKMEHIIYAPKAGKIKELFIAEGQQVTQGMQLADLEELS